MKKIFYSDFSRSDDLDNSLSKGPRHYRRDQKQTAQFILEHLHDPVMALDGDCRVVSINKSCTDLLGLDSDDIFGVHACLFLDCTKEQLLLSLERPSGKPFKTKVKGKNGYYIYWYFSAVEGSRAGAVKMIAQGKVQRRSRRKTSFIGAIFSYFMRKYHGVGYLSSNDLYFPTDIFSR